MKNLVDEYFKRDLTEAEEQQLADWLASNPEDAQRMAQGMEKMYLKSGLPQPVWPGGALPFGKSKWWILKPMTPLLLLFTLIGFTAYKWLATMPAADSVEPPPTPAPLHPEKSLPEKLKGVTKAVKPMVKQAAKNVQAAVPLSASSGIGGGRPQLPLNPVDSTASKTSAPAVPSNMPQMGHTYEQLWVVVDQATPGLVTVKVKDSLNTNIRTLYAGILDTGKKTFVWDGKTDLGVVAPPGKYVIEVQSGQNVRRHEVNLESGAVP